MLRRGPQLHCVFLLTMRGQDQLLWKRELCTVHPEATGGVVSLLNQGVVAVRRFLPQRP
jgi:hypothetical protein